MQVAQYVELVGIRLNLLETLLSSTGASDPVVMLGLFTVVGPVVGLHCPRTSTRMLNTASRFRTLIICLEATAVR